MIKKFGMILVLILMTSAVYADVITVMAANTTSGSQQAYEGPGIRIFQGLQPDVVLIQEFNYESGTLRNLVDMALGPEYDYYVEGGSENIPNGIISRFPILSAGQWADSQVSDRDFAWAIIDIPGDKHLQVVSVHLKTGSSSTQNLQAQAIQSMVASNFNPAHYIVVGGDMNTTSRSSAAIQTFNSFLDPYGHTPVDQYGDSDTNESRAEPYDWVIPNDLLDNYQIPLVISSSTYTNGLVFDSSVYTPLSQVSPVQYGDSHVSGMQHMAVMQAYDVPNSGATSTPGSTATPTATPGTGTGDVWINEIHYDNDGGDLNEGIEIAGPSGLSLSGYSLVAYNGNGGSEYSTIPLSGTIPNQQDCLGTLWFTVTGLQNGAPDGIALVGPGSVVIQFLSYEGSFTANDGAAAGLTSTDIGVMEIGTALATESLQLGGTGAVYADFTWQSPLTSNNGGVNLNQTFSGGCGGPTNTPVNTPTNTPVLPTNTPAPATNTPTNTPTPGPATNTPTPGSGSGDPWINEIHYDNASGDANEGVEVAGPSGLSLSGYTLVPYNGSGGTQYSSTPLSGSIPNLQDCLGTIWFAIVGLQNGAPDGVALVGPGDVVIQFLSYEGSFTATDGPASGMTSTDIGVAESGATTATESLQLGGTGSAYTDFTWQSPLTYTQNAVNQNQTFSGGCSGPTNTPVNTPTNTPTNTPAPPTSTPIPPTPTPIPVNDMIWVEDVLGCDGFQMVVPVMVDNPDTAFDAFTFHVGYDDTMFTYESCQEGDLNPGWTMFSCNEGSPGDITVLGFTTNAGIPAGSNGTLVNLRFTVVCPGCNPGDNAWFTIHSMLDDIAPFQITDGLFTYDCSATPTPTPSITPVCVNHGDVTLNGIITAGDAQLSFNIALETYSPSVEEFCAADCNASGTVTAGDAQSIFQAALELGSCVDPV